MAALIKLGLASLNTPEVSPDALVRSQISEDNATGRGMLEGVGKVPNGFYFPFLQSVQGTTQLEAITRTLESGGKFADHANQGDTIINLSGHIAYGKRGERDNVYQWLLGVQTETRKEPASMVVSDPWQVFQAVVIENVQVRTDPRIRYGPDGQAWYLGDLQIRSVNLLGSEADGGDSSSTVNSGAQSATEEESGTP